MPAFDFIFTAVLIVFCIYSCNASPPIPPDPVAQIDFPDPCATYYNGTFYAFGGNHAMSSKDLTTWTSTYSYLEGLPDWAVEGSQPGAPSIIQISDRKWNMYFQLPQKGCSGVCNCIGVGTASHPGHRFQAVKNIDPIICDPQYNHVVDPSARRIDNKLVLYWKTTNNSTQQCTSSNLWYANMSDDGLSLNTDQVLLMSEHYPSNWESQGCIGCIEGPSTILPYKNKYRLFYSGGDWTSDWYAVGYGDCETPFGPCIKETVSSSWVKSYNDTVGPGGQEFFADGDGEIWMIMHGWKKGHTGYPDGMRMPRIYPVSYLEEKFGELR